MSDTKRNTQPNTPTAYGRSGSYTCAECDRDFTATVTLESADPSVGLSAGGYVEDADLDEDDAGDLRCGCGATVLVSDLLDIEREESAERRAEMLADRWVD